MQQRRRAERALDRRVRGPRPVLVPAAPALLMLLPLLLVVLLVVFVLCLLGFGRIVASEIELPNMFVNLV